MTRPYSRALRYLRRGRLENPSRARTHHEHLADDIELIRERWVDCPPIVAEQHGSTVRIVARNEAEAEKILWHVRKAETDIASLITAIAILVEVEVDAKQRPEANDDLGPLIRAAWGSTDPPYTGRPRARDLASQAT